MLGIKAQRIPDPDDPSKRITDFCTSQTMLAEKDFIATLKKYDKDNIDPKKVEAIKTSERRKTSLRRLQKRRRLHWACVPGVLR